MTDSKTFEFVDGDESLSICTREILDPSYGMYTWPCAPVLAQFVWHNRKQVAGKRVIELGAGTALPGMVASKCGAEVVLTDKSEPPDLLENCSRSCKMNHLGDNIKILDITWGRFNSNIMNLPPVDFILASDCFYNSDDFEPVIATVYYLMEKNPAAHMWTTYQERSSMRSIAYLLDRWNMKSTEIPLKDFNADDDFMASAHIPATSDIYFFDIQFKHPR
ncbi:histone-arginine methyltransferase METTL23-like [Oscarella lobularis]|uniref:histone-arginine methyltransferase METTL23-like n=1 Tax=Oscarella lobularis TaxID=121494 RepID=UPI0033140E07